MAPRSANVIERSAAPASRPCARTAEKSTPSLEARASQLAKAEGYLSRIVGAQEVLLLTTEALQEVSQAYRRSIEDTDAPEAAPAGDANCADLRSWHYATVELYGAHASVTSGMTTRAARPMNTGIIPKLMYATPATKQARAATLPDLAENMRWRRS